ncbi:hypothetical protein CCP4SC76_5550001 [Gammaproteobacteria bacterium]
MFESSYGDGLRTGRKEGREEGREEGEHTKALAIARNLLVVMDDASIANITGLPLGEVTALRRPSSEL